jgi:hypothetical protein
VYHVSHDRATVTVVLEGKRPIFFKKVSSHEEEEANIRKFFEEEFKEARDTLTGRLWPQGPAPQSPPDLLRPVTLDAQGSLIGFTSKGLLVRVTLQTTVKPAHLQPPPAPISNGPWRFSTNPKQGGGLDQDWGRFLHQARGQMCSSGVQGVSCCMHTHWCCALVGSTTEFCSVA